MNIIWIQILLILTVSEPLSSYDALIFVLIFIETFLTYTLLTSLSKRHHQEPEPYQLR